MLARIGGKIEGGRSVRRLRYRQLTLFTDFLTKKNPLRRWALNSVWRTIRRQVGSLWKTSTESTSTRMSLSREDGQYRTLIDVIFELARDLNVGLFVPEPTRLETEMVWLRGAPTHAIRALSCPASLTGKMKKPYAARNRGRGGGYRQVLCGTRGNSHNATRGIDDRTPAVSRTDGGTNAN